MQFTFDCVEDDVPNLRVPSNYAQTLLAKAVFENVDSPASIACVALASKSIQNSSMGANAAAAFKISREAVDLFLTVFHPALCFSVQLTPELSVIADPPVTHAQHKSLIREADDKKLIGFVTALRQTKYFEKSLQKLDLEYCWDRLALALLGPDVRKQLGDNETDSSSSSHFPQLKSLWCWRPIISDETFTLLFASAALSKLTELNFSSAIPAVRFVEGIASLHDLKKLSWNDNDEPKDQLVENILSDHPKLESLHLNGCDGITGSAISDMIVRGKFSQLSELSLSGDQVDDHVATDIAAHLGGLTMLQLCACNELTDDGVKMIASSLSNLTRLNLQYCDKVTEKSLEFITGGLKRLTLLELFGIMEGTAADEELEKVKLALPKCRIKF